LDKKLAEGLEKKNEIKVLKEGLTIDKVPDLNLGNTEFEMPNIQVQTPLSMMGENVSTLSDPNKANLVNRNKT